MNIATRQTGQIEIPGAGGPRPTPARRCELSTRRRRAERDVDFSLPAEHVDLQRKTRAFIADKNLPLENDPRCTAHGPDADLRRELIALAKGAGLLAAHMPRELGGLGLDHVGKAVVFEEAGYSPLGPVAMNIAAPDEATGSGSGL